MNRTVGVEEEFLLYAPDTAPTGTVTLRAVGDAVVDGADGASDGQFEHELKQEQVELGSTPHRDLEALATELRRRRHELAHSAAQHGSRIVAMGTAPTAQSPTGTPDERYERMGEVFGETARSALSCGMHVHVGVDSRADGVRALTAIRPWLPVVLALSANSPYWDGRDTGYQSWRAMLWQQWPTAGPVSAFADVADYERTCAAVVESGAAVDDGMLYFDARLSASYPTLEIRVADVCARVEDAVAIAGLCRAIVVGALDGALPSVDAVAGRVEVLRAAVWRAARYGIGGALLNPSTMRLAPAGQVIGELLSALRTVLPEADAAALTGALAGIARRGTGSALQRRAFERERRTADLVDALAEATLS